MNHDPLSDRMIAQTIDLVARQMTEAEPPSDLRARVIAALPARTPHRWMRIAIPATAIAGLVIIAMMNGAAWLERSKGPTVQGSEGPGDVTPVESPAVAEASAGTATGPLDRWTVGPLDRAADVPLSSHIEPLAAVVPLSIEPIQPIRVSIAPITVTPIVTEPLTVPALDSRAGGRE